MTTGQFSSRSRASVSAGCARSSLKRITQAHQVLNPPLAYFFEDLVKGKTVTVDV
jgi:hypothetical protein